MTTAAPNALRPPSARGRALILLSFVVVYSVACALPAVRLTGRRDAFAGVEVMVMGWHGLRMAQYGWLANFPALIALRCVMQGRTLYAIILAAVSLLLGLHSFWLMGHEIVLGDEPLNTVRVVSLASGYYVWMATLALPLAFALLLRRPRSISQAAWSQN